MGLQTAAAAAALHYLVRALCSKSAMRLSLPGRRKPGTRELAYTVAVAVGWVTLAGHAAAGALSWFPPTWETARLCLAGAAALSSLVILVCLERFSNARQELEQRQRVLAWLWSFLKQHREVQACDLEQLRHMEQQARSDADRCAARYLQHLLEAIETRDNQVVAKQVVAAAFEKSREQDAVQQEPQAVVKDALERIARESAREALASP